MDVSIQYLAYLSIVCCLALLVMMALVAKGVKEIMDTEKFNKLAIKLVKHNFYDPEKDKDVVLETVWQAHLLGNKKAILCDLDPTNNFIYEVTYNGSKNEFFVDKYDKVGKAHCFADPETMAVFTAEFERIKE